MRGVDVFEPCLARVGRGGCMSGEIVGVGCVPAEKGGASLLVFGIFDLWGKQDRKRGFFILFFRA